MFFASPGGNLTMPIQAHVCRSTSFAISLLRRRAPRNAPVQCTWAPRDVSPTSLRHIHGSCASYFLSRLLRDVDGRRRSPARVCDVVSSQVRRRNASRVSYEWKRRRCAPNRRRIGCRSTSIVVVANPACGVVHSAITNGEGIGQVPRINLHAFPRFHLLYSCSRAAMARVQ